MSQSLNELLEEYISDNMGKYIIDSIERMLEWGDMTPFQKLCVIDGAIAFGKWQCTPSEMEELRAIRSELIQEYDYD